MPESVKGIRNCKVLLTWPGRTVVGRARAVVGSGRANCENIQVGWQSARPRVLESQFSRHRFVEGGGWSREHHRQIVVVAQSRRADVLYADIYKCSAAYRSEVPGQRARSAADCAAGRRSGLR